MFNIFFIKTYRKKGRENIHRMLIKLKVVYLDFVFQFKEIDISQSLYIKKDKCLNCIENYFNGTLFNEYLIKNVSFDLTLYSIVINLLCCYYTNDVLVS